MQTDQEWSKDTLYLLVPFKCQTATALVWNGLLLESLSMSHSYLVHCITKVFRIHKIWKLWSLYYIVYYTEKPHYSKSKSYFWWEKFKGVREKKAANDASKNVQTMTLCLKGTPRKGRLGSSPDDLDMFNILYFLFYMYIDMHILVYIPTQIYVCTDTFEVLRTEKFKI